MNAIGRRPQPSAAAASSARRAVGARPHAPQRALFGLGSHRIARQGAAEPSERLSSSSRGGRQRGLFRPNVRRRWKCGDARSERNGCATVARLGRRTGLRSHVGVGACAVSSGRPRTVTIPQISVCLSRRVKALALPTHERRPVGGGQHARRREDRKEPTPVGANASLP